uniref:Ras-related protein RABB1c-like n=1 Tax=Rhizophora mucronata TaxID=61149 RepID=A0A2P2KEW9_RHIMU
MMMYLNRYAYDIFRPFLSFFSFLLLLFFF